MGNWEKIFREDGRVFTKTHEDMRRISKIFKKNNFKRILDMGCGTGRHTVYLSKMGFDIYGFDISRTGVRLTKNWLSKEKLKANVIVHDMNKRFPYADGFFDAIVSVQVLSHCNIVQTRKVINEMHRVLKVNGLLFISVQNWVSMAGKKHRMIAPQTYIPLEGKEKGVVHHYFTKSTAYHEFKKFKIIDFYVDSGMQFCILCKKAV
jgi:SAM-dependent methyltransferase